MTESRLAVTVLTGSLAMFLGFSSVLDDLVQGIRNYNVIGTPQHITRPRDPQPVSRFARLCFVASGATVILVALLAAVFAR